MTSLSSVRKNFALFLCSNVPLTRLSCLFSKHLCPKVQTFDIHQIFLVRLYPNFCAFTKFSCVHVQTFVRSKTKILHSEIVPSCVHVQTNFYSKQFLHCRLKTFNFFSCTNFFSIYFRAFLILQTKR